MDAPLNQPKDDRALRALFQEMGPMQAPAGMSSGVLQRIALLPRQRVVEDKALLPTWTWFVIAALVVLIVCLAATSGGGTSTFGGKLPTFDLAALLTSKWTLGAALSAALLFAFDLWLDRRRMVEARIA